MSIPSKMDAFDAELSVIGSAFLSETAVERSGCTVADFYAPRHRAVWAAIQALRGRQQPIDAVTVQTELERTGRLDAAGGAEYVADLSEASATHMNVAHHGGIVRQAAQARALRSLFAGAVKALDEGWAMDGLSGMHAAAMGLTDAAVQSMAGRDKQRGHAHHEAVRFAVERAYAAYQALRDGSQAVGVPVLLPHVNEHDATARTLGDIIAPLAPTDLMVIAARTSSGKTVAGWQFAHDAAARTGRVVDYFTSEVDAGGMGGRSLARHAQVDSTRLRAGTITDAEVDRMLAYSKARARQPVMVWDAPMQTIEYISAMCRVADAARPEDERGGLVVIDYYQRTQSTEADRRRMDKHARLAYLSPVIKGLAMQLKRPVVLLAQLRRDLVWGQESKEDIDGSKTLGEEADVMVYIRNAQADLPESDAPPGYAEFFVPKNRNGQVGGVLPVRFNGPRQQFEAWKGERWTPSRGRR